MSDYEVEANIKPEFKEEIETHFLLDFSDDEQSPQHYFALGQLTDHENDDFIVE